MKLSFVLAILNILLSIQLFVYKQENHKLGIRFDSYMDNCNQSLNYQNTVIDKLNDDMQQCNSVVTRYFYALRRFKE